MKILPTWKLFRSTRRARIRYLHIRVMPLATRTCNRPPPAICLTDIRNREYFPGWVPSFSESCSTAIEHIRQRLSPCLVLCAFVCFIFIVSSPLFSPVDLRDRWRCPGDRLLHRRRPPLLPQSNQASKPPWRMPLSPSSSSLLLALVIAATMFYPIFDA